MTSEYKVLVPLFDNDGKDVNIDAIRQFALGSFSGYTQGAEVAGAWRDESTGIVYEDRLLPFYVAGESDNQARTFAQTVAMVANQICVYLKFPDGRVEFIEQ